MKSTLYNTLKTALFGLLLCAASCQKSYELKLPLAIDNPDVALTADAGSTHVMVYSTGEWRVSFAEPVAWAEINKSSGRGNGDFVFTYTANAGLSRKATLLVERDGEAKQIVLLQAGSLSDPTLMIGDGNVALIRDGLWVNIPLHTNLEADLDRIRAEVTYAHDDAGSWISEVSFDTESLRFKVADNTDAEGRLAVVRLSITDAKEQSYTTSTTVSQGAAAATLDFKELESPYDAAPGGETITLELNTNLSSYYAIRPVVDYRSATPGWLSHTIDAKGLRLVVAANKDAMREATFALAYTTNDGNEVKSSLLTLTQDKDAEKISFEALRTRVSASETITDNLFIEGIVVSDCNSKNMEFNPNTSEKVVDMTPNDKTAYIQSLDGKYGFRLQFTDPAENTLKRYDKISLSIRKTTVTCQATPTRYTISGLKAFHVLATEAGTSADLTTKRKTIATLTDADLYTFVSLTDMELVFKSGSYTNIYEPYSQKSPLNTAANANGRGDGWATPLCDAANNTIYMMVNSLCQWRRPTTGVPKGIGTMSGILVHTTMPRYGDNLGNYQIRPIDDKDIDIARSEASSFKTIVEWNWDNVTPSLNFEKAGTTASSIANDRVLADIGTGFFSANTGGTIGYGADYNALVILANNKANDRGILKNGGMCFYTPANKWWDWVNNRGNAISMEFSSEQASGSAMSLNFSFGAGSISAVSSKDFPACWQIEYSTDGTTFTKLDRPNITLRSVPWWEAAGTPATSCEAGLGFTEHRIQLPATLLGKERVILRLSPANKTIATLDAFQSASGTLTSTLTTATFIRFGCVSIQYK